MILEYGDWKFDVDVEATKERTRRYSFDHCECGYCKNFYEVIDQAHPQLRPALEPFGIHLEGPCEMVPFEPTLMLACYRVDGKIAQWGGAGASVPLTGFGSNLAKGVAKAVGEKGWLGVFTGPLTAAAGGIAAAMVFGVLAALLFRPGEKR